MAREKLGEIRARILKRYEEVSEELKNFSAKDLVEGKFEKRLYRILTEFGVDYPLTFDKPPPDVYVPARQGTKCLDPKGTNDGMTPVTKLDELCLTFRARDGGFLVIDSLDFIMEDPIAEDWFTIEYKFDEQVNTATFQKRNGDTEPGHWKFNRVVLIDGEVMTVCVKNTNPFAGGCFSFEGRMWSL